MRSGSFLATWSTATLCLLVLGGCSTSEEAPADTTVASVEAPRPLPPPEAPLRSRLLMVPAGLKAPLPSDTEADQRASPRQTQETRVSLEAQASREPEERGAAPQEGGAAPQERAVPPAEPQAAPSEAPARRPPTPRPRTRGAAPPEPEQSREREEHQTETKAEAAKEVEAGETEAPGDEAAQKQTADAPEETSQNIDLDSLKLESQEQQASLPQAAPPEKLQLSFEAGAVELTAAMEEQLMEIARRLREHERERVQLLAYASGYDKDIARARRLSLSRALAVRAFLLDQGIRSTRMDVRAIARDQNGGPPDRVDLVPRSD